MFARSAIVSLVLVASASQTLAAQEGPGQYSVPDKVQSTATVAVLDFGGSALGRYAADFATLGAGIPHHLSYALAKNPSIRLVDRHRLQDIVKEQDLSSAGRVDSSSLVRAGKILGAHHMLSGSFIIQGDGVIAISVTSTNVETSRVEYSERVTGRANKVLDLLDQLADKLNAGMKLPPIPATAPRPPATPASVDQNKLILLEGAALKAEDKGDVKGAVALWRQVLAISPDYKGATVRVAVLETPK